jgi:galactokinase
MNDPSVAIRVLNEGAGLSSNAALTVATQRCLQKLWGYTMP